MSQRLEELLARLAAAGVAEPSTLVFEFRGEPAGPNAVAPRTAMSSRVARPGIEGAVFFPRGLADGYVTYELPWAPWPGGDESLSPNERLAFGLRESVEAVRAQGVPVRRFVATGWTSSADSIDRGLLQTLADVLGERIVVRPCRNVADKGRRILDVLSGSHGYVSAARAVKALADVESIEQKPVRRDLRESRRYEALRTQWRGRRAQETAP